MIVDFSNWNQISAAEVSVIGAGAAGMYIAALLAEAGRTVSLFESGDLHHTQRASALNRTKSIGRPHGGATNGRARIVGGTTTLWGGQLTYFNQADFYPSHKTGPRWQLSLEELAPHYRAVAEVLGLDPAMLTDQAIFDATGIQRNLGDPYEVFFTRWLRQPNFADFFGELIRKSPKLTLVKNAHVRRLYCDNEGQVKTLLIAAPDGTARGIECHTVILAAGTVEVSRLLLLSAAECSNLPWATNKNIGRYFQDHIDIDFGRIPAKSAHKVASLFEGRLIRGYKYQPKLRFKGEQLPRGYGIAVSAKFESRLADDIALLKHVIRSARQGKSRLQLLSRFSDLVATWRVWFPLAWRYLRHRRIASLYDGGITLTAHAEHLGLANSTISLADEVDEYGDRRAKIHWLVDSDMINKSLAAFLKELGHAFMETYECDLTLFNADVEIFCEPTAAVRDSYHLCGGACMSDSLETGVVDRNLQVFGTKNLFVAGAAVFPTSSYANPTYTALALANRLAATILSLEQVERK
jgi:choline dehydrogenase-like flavoprotein